MSAAGEKRRQALRQNLVQFAEEMPPLFSGERKVQSAIVPVIVGSADGAVALAARRADEGLFVPAIRPPSVPAGGSLVRASLACHHTDDDLDRLARALSGSRE